MRRIVFLALAVCVAACATAKGSNPGEKRAYIREMRNKALGDLYKAKPSAQQVVEKSAGYAVFSNLGLKVIFVAAGEGYGIVVNARTREETFMKMAEAGVGVGLGAKDFRAIFVFHSERVLRRFVDKGWEFSADAEATAKSDDKGGSAAASGTFEDITIYQLTESGLAAQATVMGTKYWKDKDLN